MTGQELLLKLLALSKKDLEKRVEVEGCDCVRRAKGVDVEREMIVITSH